MRKLVVLLASLALGLALLTACTSDSPSKTLRAHSARTHAQAAEKKHRITEQPALHWQRAAAPVQLPILMYHNIAKGPNSLFVPTTEFAQQMAWIHRHHFLALTPEQAYRVLATNEIPGRRLVLITLDDGYRNNWINARPILTRYHLHATIFMIGNRIGKPTHLTTAQMRLLVHDGIAIESHTIHHLDLSTLTPAQQHLEIFQSKVLFNHLLRQNTTMISYPSGRYSNETLALTKQAGYRLAVTTHPGLADKAQGLLALHRERISPGLPLSTFAAILNASVSAAK
ncbi:MAG: polysaccharide deacetylase family protein [Sporolactobacillus sp.]